jgi:hypothetical protein
MLGDYLPYGGVRNGMGMERIQASHFHHCLHSSNRSQLLESLSGNDCEAMILRRLPLTAIGLVVWCLKGVKIFLV